MSIIASLHGTKPRCSASTTQRRRRILWQDDDGKPVPPDGATVSTVLKGWTARAEPEYPDDKTSARANGPKRKAFIARRVRRRAVSSCICVGRRGRPLERCLRSSPAARGKKSASGCRSFSTGGGKTRRQLPSLRPHRRRGRATRISSYCETLTYFGLGKSYADCAGRWTINGYFGTLARGHNLYIVAGL